MALKEWEKIKNTKDEIIWRGKYHDLKVLRLHHSLGRKFYWIVTNKEYDRPYLREYRTKSQALKFAKAYMRKH